MSILSDFLERLPPNNKAAFAGMLSELPEDFWGFVEDHLSTGIPLASNITRYINQAFINAGFAEFRWDNCQIDTSKSRFDHWF